MQKANAISKELNKGVTYDFCLRSQTPYSASVVSLNGYDLCFRKKIALIFNKLDLLWIERQLWQSQWTTAATRSSTCGH